MNLVWAVLIIVAATTVAVAAMLRVRRGASDGSYFNDGDRASGVFGVLATGLAVLLGFVVFLAFTSYDASRAGAEAEALTVAQQLETAQFFPPAVVGELTGELVCYARSVARGERARMEPGTLGEHLNPWAVELFRTLKTVQPKTASEQAAYGKWLNQTSDREAARSDRTHGAVGVIPTPLWLALFFAAGVIFLYMLFFADSGECVVVQAMLMGSVVAMIVTLLLLLRFLDNPSTPASVAFAPLPCCERCRFSTRSSARPTTTSRSPATPAEPGHDRPGGNRTGEHGAQAGLGGDRRGRAAGPGGGRDGLEQLPVDAGTVA
jgi:hypothetical protein